MLLRFAPARPSVAGRSLLPEQYSGSTLCVDRRSSIHGASNSDFGARHPWRDAVVFVLHRPGHPWPVVRSCPSSTRARRYASTVAPLSMARVIVISVPAIPGATQSSLFCTGPAIRGRSFAPARAVLGLDAARRPSLTHLRSWVGSELHCLVGSTPEKVLERSRRRSRRRF